MQPSTRVRQLAGKVRTVLGWAVLVGLLAVIGAAVAVPRVAGATPYVVLTGSMAPTLPPGTLVVVRPVRPEQVVTGDVITYQLRSGEPEVVTHRVVAVGVNGEGERVLRTRGDANGADDPAWVRPVQVRGEEWYAVPWVGRASMLLDPGQRELATTALACGLLAYAGWSFAGAWRSRRHRPRAGARRLEVS